MNETDFDETQIIRDSYSISLEQIELDLQNAFELRLESQEKKLERQKTLLEFYV